MVKVIVKPVSRKMAAEICKEHPHASSLPNSAKYYMVGYLNGKVCGLAVWGYGIVPRQTPNYLFKEQGKLSEYLELCRFFVYDWVPKNTPTAFLSATHRIIKKYAPGIKWLYTYAAGFQGLTGTIYQAANYDYIGTKLTKLIYLPEKKAIVHPIAVWHRYSTANLKELIPIFGDAKTWVGYNFAYIYWLCSDAEKEQLMKTATFKIHTTKPTKNDLKIWTEDVHGNKEEIDIEIAKQIPLIKLKTGKARQ